MSQLTHEEIKALLTGLIDEKALAENVSDTSEKEEDFILCENTFPSVKESIPALNNKKYVSPVIRTTDPEIDFPLTKKNMPLDIVQFASLDVSVEIGKLNIPLKEVLMLSEGSLIKLNKPVNDDVNIIVNKNIVGQGRVIVSEERFGVQVTQLRNDNSIKNYYDKELISVK